MSPSRAGVKLADVARVQSGSAFPVQHQGQRDLEFPFYKVGDMNLDGNEIEMRAETNSISDLTRRKLGAAILPSGSVIFPKVGGAIATNKKRLIVRPACVDNNVMGVIPDPNKIDSRLLFYFFQAHDLSEFANDAGLPSITKTTVENWAMGVIPPLPEQHRIVALLDEAFVGVATAQANAKKSLQRIDVLFESRLESILSASKDSVSYALGDATGGVFTGPFGSLLHKGDYVDCGIPLVNPAHITDEGIEPDQRKTVTAETAERLSSYRLKEGDIVIGRRGEMGRCAVVTQVEAGWLCGTGSFVIRSSERCDSRFLVRLLRSQRCRRELEEMAGGAVMPNLSNTDLARFVIDVPPIEAQLLIVQQLEALDYERRHLQSLYTRKLAALDELKQTLLQQAFSGQLN